MKILIQFLKTNKLLFFITVSMVSLQNITMLLIPFLISDIISYGIMQQNFDVVTYVGKKMVGILIVGTVSGILGSYFASDFASRFGKKSRRILFRNIQHLTLDEVDKYGVASLVTRLLSDNVNVQQIIVTFFQMILPSPIMSIASIILTYQVSPKLALIPLLSIVLFIVVVLLVLNKSNVYIKQIQINIDKMTSVLREFFNGVKIIRAFDNSSYERKRVNRAFKNYSDNGIKINQLFAVLSPLAYTLMTVAMALIICLGSILVFNGEIHIGSITAAIEYSTITIATLIMSALVIFQFPRAIASLERISTVALQKSDMKDSKESVQLVKGRKYKLLSFENVTFRYNGAEKPVLDDISFSINRGETLAIVGGTGSGKSSIAKVLLRFNDIESGSIKIENQETKKMSQSELREYISFVPQRSFLFSGTIRDNIKFGNEKLTDKDLIKVAKTAQAFDFIQGLKDGFDSYVAQGGTNFSGGQKQRLAISRALAKPADIYLFDDSFSALDYATDAKLREAIKKELTESAVIIIAQRISTITHADTIILLDKGKIIGKGTHEELLKSNNFYKELAISQNLISEKEVL